MPYRFRDPVSGLTHLAGALLGVAGLVFLMGRAIAQGSTGHIVSFAVFGTSLVLMYSASSLYHLLDVSPETRLILRRIDHTMISILIAGTYTPFCLLALRGTWGYVVLALVWLLTLGGMVMSIAWIHAPRWLSTTIYLLTGWIALAVIYPLSQALPVEGMAWLIGGGLFYTVGAIIYALKWPDPFPPHFGFHEIWHLFVLAGSASHFISVSTIA